MDILGFPKGEISGVNDKIIPEGGASLLRNLEPQGNTLQKRYGEDQESNLTLAFAMDEDKIPSGVWKWKPAVNTAKYGDTLYLVFYETEQEFQLFYNNTTQNTEVTKPLNATLSIDDLTVFLSPNSIIITDGTSKGYQVRIDVYGKLKQGSMGLESPSTAPVLSDPVFTDLDDQDYFGSPGILRTAITYVDKNGIESNPSPISNALLCQKFKYDEGEQVNQILSLNVYIYIDEELEETLDHINIYTQLILYTEGEDTGTFIYAAEQFIVAGDNEFFLKNSGFSNDIMSYENDVAQIAAKAVTAEGITVLSSPERSVNPKEDFKYLQKITLINNNPQSFVDKLVRIRLYYENYESAPSNQRITNFNPTEYRLSDLRYIRLYDTQLKTPLVTKATVFADNYIEVLVLVTMLSGQNKDIYLAFTPGAFRVEMPGYAIDKLGGYWNDNDNFYSPAFKNIEVYDAGTKIAYANDDTSDGEVNLADENLSVDKGDEPNWTPPFYAPYTKYLDIGYIPGGEPKMNKVELDIGGLSPKSFFVSARFSIKLYQTSTSNYDATLYRIFMPQRNQETKEELILAYDWNTDEIAFFLVTTDATLGFDTVEIDLLSLGDDSWTPTIWKFSIADYKRVVGGDEYLEFYFVWTAKEKSEDDWTSHMLFVPINSSSPQTNFYGRRLAQDIYPTIGTISFGGDNDDTVISQIIFRQNLYPDKYVDDYAIDSMINAANYMPIYRSEFIGRRWIEGDGYEEKNENVLIGQQRDTASAYANVNNNLFWSEKYGLNFPDQNVHRIPGANTVNVPVRSFFNNQYVTTVLCFTSDTISRLIFNEASGDLVNKNRFIEENYGFGCDNEKFMCKYGDTVYWYSSNKNELYEYFEGKPKCLSVNRITFSGVKRIFANPAKRQIIILESARQVVYHVEYGWFTSFTGLDCAFTAAGDSGKTLLLKESGGVYSYPSDGETSEIPYIDTAKYYISGLLRRIKPAFLGDTVYMKTVVEYRSGYLEDIPGATREVSSGESYRINKNCEYFKIILSNLSRFINIKVEV